MWSRADRYFAATASFALLALIVSFVAIGAGVAALTDDGDGGQEVSAGEPVTLEVSLGEFFVEPSSITVPAGTDLTLVVTNDGT